MQGRGVCARARGYLCTRRDTHERRVLREVAGIDMRARCFTRAQKGIRMCARHHQCARSLPATSRVRSPDKSQAQAYTLIKSRTGECSHVKAHR